MMLANARQGITYIRGLQMPIHPERHALTCHTGLPAKRLSMAIKMEELNKPSQQILLSVPLELRDDPSIQQTARCCISSKWMINAPRNKMSFAHSSGENKNTSL